MTLPYQVFASNKSTESFTKEIEYFFQVDKKLVEKPTVIILINKNYYKIVEALILLLYKLLDK